MVKILSGRKYVSIYQELKKILTTSLVQPNPTGHFVIFCDASKIRLRCVLMQDKKRVVGYASSKLRAHEINYSTHDLELVIIAFALKYAKLCV